LLLQIWLLLGLVYATCWRQRKTQIWLQEYFSSHRRLLDEARDRRAELEQSRSDWIHASRQLVLANERLASLKLCADEARRGKADFVARVSHEFRTPLNIIIGMVSLMVEAPQVYGQEFPSKAMDQLRIVYKNCQHLASMIDDVLDLSQCEAGKVSLRRTRVDIGQIIDTALDVVKPLAEQKGLQLIFGEREQVPPLDCDGVRVRQVILNLLSNATRYTEKGTVSVSLHALPSRVRVGVSDTGPGIPPHEKERIFEAFGRGDKAILSGQLGSGLGLAISRELIAMHGGTMWLETQEGVGSTFYFELPMTIPAPLVRAPVGQIREDWIWRQRTSWADLSQAVSRRRIIVCGAGEALKGALAHYDDRAELVCLDSLADAIGQARDLPADAIIVNASRPDDLWRDMSLAREAISSTPIIGCCWPPTKAKFGRVIASYITKPVDKEELLAAISALERRVQRVLVADDDADTREFLRTLLASYDPRIGVQMATCGQAAIAAASLLRPDLILLDVVMPDMTGWDVLARLESNGLLGETAVLMVSALDPFDEPLRSECFVATIGGGVSVGKMLSSSSVLSTLFLGPD